MVQLRFIKEMVKGSLGEAFRFHFLRVAGSLMTLLALHFPVFSGAQLTQPFVHRFLLHEGWTYSDSSGLGMVGQATIPGSIHLDLLKNGQITDPYYRDEITRLGWVDSATWCYQLKCPPLGFPTGAERAELVFDGLDTRADVFINGEQVLETDNMFRQWRIPLAPEWMHDSMEIRVLFHSPLAWGKILSERVDWTYPADSDPFPGKPSVFLRKAAYQFGWDFAPPLPGCGIWKSVYIDVWTSARWTSGWVQTLQANRDTAEIVVEGILESDQEQDLDISAWFGEHGRHLTIGVHSGQNRIRIPFKVPYPQLWWPHDQGNPALTQVVMIAQTRSGSDTLTWQAGIRTVELDQKPDQEGTPFRFIINGRPVFMAGANWVPADMFPARVTAVQYRDLLLAARDAGMNMLRVWGGGIYESDRFYHLADSLGVLIWQDFMFANTMYPGDSLFKENVHQEAIEQIIRLRSHPSLAFWCGNNEIDVAWKNWGWSTTYQYTREIEELLEKDYHRLFRELLPSLVEQYTGTDYIHTSPLSNWGDPADLAHGDNHFWGVWHGEMALDSLRTRIPRFMSEYGMQSFPTWASIQRFSIPEDWAPGSTVMKHHQRSYKGNGLITKYLQMEGEGGDLDFRSWVEKGHQVQARAYGIALEAHLGAQPFCMGSLLWQFNEPWPGASWSIIDYYGEKKPAYHTLQHILTRQD